MIAGMLTPEDRQRTTDLMREAFTAAVSDDMTTAVTLVGEALMPDPRHSLVVWHLCAHVVGLARAEIDQVMQVTVDVGATDPDAAVQAARLVELFVAAHAGGNIAGAAAAHWDALESVQVWMTATRILFELAVNVLSVDVPAGELPEFLHRLELGDVGI